MIQKSVLGGLAVIYIFNSLETPEEKEKIKQFISSNLKTLSSTLSEMRSEMILLLKINGYLRSIDSKIGNPINNYNMMVKYSIKELDLLCLQTIEGGR